MVDRVGQQLGNYRLIRLIGYGGFAEVYLGEHVFLKTQSAIKVLTIQLTNENMEAFQKEAQTIAQLIHPHIVRVLEFGVEGATPYLVMDYAPNGTLRQKYARGMRLAPAEIAPHIKQAAEALQYAHDQKLIHRDVKPENFLLGRNHEVLLSDFGIALVAQSSRHPGMQEVVGTVTYMAPEQIQGQPRAASDEYSLAIIAYEWLSGATPFQGTFTELCTQHLYARPAPLREKFPELPPAVEEVVMTALAKDPKERFATVAAFATALEQASKTAGNSFPVSATLGSPAVTPPAPLPTPPLQVTPSQPSAASGEYTPTSGQMPPSLAQYAPLSELQTKAMQLPVESGKATPLPGQLAPSLAQLPPTAPQQTPTLGLSQDQISETVFSAPTYIMPPSQEGSADLGTQLQPKQSGTAFSPAPDDSTPSVSTVVAPAVSPPATTSSTLSPVESQPDQPTVPAFPAPMPAMPLAGADDLPLITSPTFQVPLSPQTTGTLPEWPRGIGAPPVQPPTPPPSIPFTLPPVSNQVITPAVPATHNAAPPPARNRKKRELRPALVLALVAAVLFLGGGAALFAFMQSSANQGVAINSTATSAPTIPIDTATSSLEATSTVAPTTTTASSDTATPQPTATDTPRPGPTNTPKPRPTNTPKPPPALTAPAQINPCNRCSYSYSPHSLTFKWGAVAGAPSYRLQVYRYATGATSCSGGSLVLDTTVGGTSFGYTFVSAANQPGCWRVAAIGNGTQGPYSGLWFFVFTQ